MLSKKSYPEQIIGVLHVNRYVELLQEGDYLF